MNNLQPDGVCGIPVTVPESKVFIDARKYYIQYQNTRSVCGMEKSSLAQLQGFSFAATKKILSTSSDEALNEFLGIYCPEKSLIKLPELAYKNYSLKNFEAVKQSLRDTMRGSPAQPALIGYCANILKTPDYLGTSSRTRITHNGALTLKDLEESCKGHANLVIGRRKSGTKCQYLLRNSWGSDCDSYASTLNCENGNIWIDEEILMKNAISLQEIGPKE